VTLESGGIIILDFGSQTAQLIARRVREAGVYAALLPYNATLEKAQSAVPDFCGVILSGGPLSASESHAPNSPAGC
jgi:GMP synthase (glutamine-hydrolysing)